MVWRSLACRRTPRAGDTTPEVNSNAARNRVDELNELFDRLGISHIFLFGATDRKTSLSVHGRRTQGAIWPGAVLNEYPIEVFPRRRNRELRLSLLIRRRSRGRVRARLVRHCTPRAPTFRRVLISAFLWNARARRGSRSGRGRQGRRLRVRCGGFLGQVRSVTMIR